MGTTRKLLTNFEKAEDSLGFMLWKASNLLQKIHTECLTGLNVTPTQFSVLTCLVFLHQQGDVTPTMIARHAGIDKMTVSDLVRTLEKKKLIIRLPNPADGRSFFVTPTRLGVKTANTAVQKVEAIDEVFFNVLRNRKTFQRSLATLVNSSLPLLAQSNPRMDEEIP